MPVIDITPESTHQIPGRGTVFDIKTDIPFEQGNIIRVDGILWEVMTIERSSASNKMGLVSRKLTQQPPSPEREAELRPLKRAAIKERQEIVYRVFKRASQAEDGKFDDHITAEERERKEELEEAIEEWDEELIGWALEPLEKTAERMRAAADVMEEMMRKARDVWEKSSGPEDQAGE